MTLKAVSFRSLKLSKVLFASPAIAALAVHFATNSRYGYFRDELYYIACGEHLAWGYIDQPPLVAIVARFSHWLLGDSLFALRFFPAIAGALAVLLTGLMAKELGGGRFAQTFAATAALVAPVYLAIDNFLSMNAFDHLFWALGAYLVIRILKRDQFVLWVPFGLVVGIGLLNKYSMGLFGTGILLGLLLTPARRHFRRGPIWAGGALALAIFSPHILWEVRHGFPTTDFIVYAVRYEHVRLPLLEFLGTQALMMLPLLLPLWLAGLYFYCCSPKGAPYRPLAWAYLFVLILVVSAKGKPYYLAPVYFMLLAAGAVLLEEQLESRAWTNLKPALFTVLLLTGVALAPYALPILPIQTFLRYEHWVGIVPQPEDNSPQGRVPELFADMMGWENLVATVAQVYHCLPPEEQQSCAILSSNYGEAGAIDFLGKRYGLPGGFSGSNNYWDWGPPGNALATVIAVGETPDELQKLFQQVTLSGVINNEWAMPPESHLRIYVCRKPRLPFERMWPGTRHFD